jgi:hypothetical protein
VDGRVVFSRQKSGAFISTPEMVELVAAQSVTGEG